MRLLPILFVLTSLPSLAIAEDDDLDTRMMRATVKIMHDDSTATGFLLFATNPDQFLLVTAAHVLEKTPGESTTVVFRAQQSEGSYQKLPTKLAIRQAGMPLWTKHPTDDVAVIGVTPPANADLPRVSVELLASDDLLRKHKVHPGEALSSLGYPHRNEASDAGFPILRRGAIGTFPLIPTAKTRTFYFSGNTFEGDSGGPVYLTRPSHDPARPGEVNLILGLVSGQMFLDEEAKMVYGTTKFRHRLGLAIIVHASLIRETIDRRSADLKK